MATEIIVHVSLRAHLNVQERREAIVRVKSCVGLPSTFKRASVKRQHIADQTRVETSNKVQFSLARVDTGAVFTLVRNTCKKGIKMRNKES